MSAPALSLGSRAASSPSGAPIKSLGGRRCETLALDAPGAVGDRAWALVAPDGTIAGVLKTTRRFRKVPTP